MRPARVAAFNARAPQDVECGAGGAQRVVLVRHRRSESGHDGVADELLDGAAVTSQRRGDDLEVALEHPPERLGVERPGQRQRLDDVDEDDR